MDKNDFEALEYQVCEIFKADFSLEIDSLEQLIGLKFVFSLKLENRGIRVLGGFVTGFEIAPNLPPSDPIEVHGIDINLFVSVPTSDSLKNGGDMFFSTFSVQTICINNTMKGECWSVGVYNQTEDCFEHYHEGSLKFLKP